MTEQDPSWAVLVDQIDDQSEVAPRIIAEVVRLREPRSDRPTRKATSNEVADDEDAGRDDDGQSGRVPTDDPILTLEAELVESHPVGKVDTRGERREDRVEGSWYCPSMPEALINATIDYLNGDLDNNEYQARIDERCRYQLHHKTQADAKGNVRLQCPAVSVSATATAT